MTYSETSNIFLCWEYFRKIPNGTSNPISQEYLEDSNKGKESDSYCHFELSPFNQVDLDDLIKVLGVLSSRL